MQAVASVAVGGGYSRELVVSGGQQQQRRAGARALHRRVQRRQHLVRVCLHCAQPHALGGRAPGHVAPHSPDSHVSKHA